LVVTVAAAGAVVVSAKFALNHIGFARHNDPLASIAARIPLSKPAKLLETQRENLILMAVASKSFSLASTPKVAALPAVAPAAPPAGPAGPAVSPAGPTAPPPSPGTAQAIAYRILPSFGFSASQQFSCLNNIWTRESGWNVTAANASGAYGIPQALPGYKMASAGPNWQTSAVTQIKWGIGYIKQRYGSPCNAWAFWQSHSWY
jgi:hypothetical protein